MYLQKCLPNVINTPIFLMSTVLFLIRFTWICLPEAWKKSGHLPYKAKHKNSPKKQPKTIQNAYKTPIKPPPKKKRHQKTKTTHKKTPKKKQKQLHLKSPGPPPPHPLPHLGVGCAGPRAAVHRVTTEQAEGGREGWVIFVVLWWFLIFDFCFMVVFDGFKMMCLFF